MSILPKHVAIIMDGNGRWAKKRRHQRVFGHVRGAKRAREVIEESHRLGIEALTLFAFSTENWQRPETEIEFLMKLLMRYLREQVSKTDTKNTRFRAIGFLEMLPETIRTEIKKVEERTKNNNGMILNLAISYGSKQEIIQAVKKICASVKAGTLEPNDVNEATLEHFLFTSDCPSLDLLIRTGGDQRISNFLLWQAAYAELCFVEKCWPDFSVSDYQKAIMAFSERERRYGRVTSHESRT